MKEQDLQINKMEVIVDGKTEFRNFHYERPMFGSAMALQRTVQVPQTSSNEKVCYMLVGPPHIVKTQEY